MDTFASNPGQLRFNPFCYWRHCPIVPVVTLSVAFLFVAIWVLLVLNGHSGTIPKKNGDEFSLWLFTPIPLAFLFMFTWPKYRKFKAGDANPGVVVDLNPTLVAVLTDLSKGNGEFPAVKIFKANLGSTEEKPLKVGTKVSTVSNYFDTAGKDAWHWGDFDPEPAQYATSDQAALKRLASSFSQDQYVELVEALKRISRPYQPGLYAMWHAEDKQPGRIIKSKNDF